jgi:hypothetical protein
MENFDVGVEASRRWSRRCSDALPQMSCKEVSRLVKMSVLVGKKGSVPPGWKTIPISSARSMASIRW